MRPAVEQRNVLRELQLIIDDYMALPSDHRPNDLSDKHLHAEFCAKPHKTPVLGYGAFAVYAFRYESVWLKVGRASDDRRFSRHHYDITSSESNLARSLFEYAHAKYRPDSRLPGLRAQLRKLEPSQFGDWIRRNTDRAHIRVAFRDSTWLRELEWVAIQRLKPVFENGWRIGRPLRPYSG